MTDSLTLLAWHVSRTLPDSISERKALLRALDHLLPARHPASPAVQAQLASIAALEKLQEDLPLRFKPDPTKV